MSVSAKSSRTATSSFCQIALVGCVANLVSARPNVLYRNGQKEGLTGWKGGKVAIEVKAEGGGFLCSLIDLPRPLD